MNQPPHIFIVDEDRENLSFLKLFFERQRFIVTCAASGAAARMAWQINRYDLVILDSALQGESKFELLRWLKSRQDVPLLMLTAFQDDNELIDNLELGADDCQRKPYNPREILARAKSIIHRSRRIEEHPALDPRCVYFSGWCVNVEKRCLIDSAGVAVDLGYQEFDLLMLFLENSNKVVCREDVMNRVYRSDNKPDFRSIDVMVSRLRRKIQRDDKGEYFIKTVRGRGYMFISSVERVSRQ